MPKVNVKKSKSMIKAIRFIRVKDLEPINTEVCHEEEYTCEDSGERLYSQCVRFDYKIINKPVGCVLCMLNNHGEPTLSWSVCAEGDQFSYRIAREVAYQRGLDKSSMNLTPEEIHQFPKIAREEVVIAISDLLAEYNSTVLR